MNASVDKVLADAVDMARDALEPIAKEREIGQHIGVENEEKLLVTHSFECLKQGYKGWRWTVTLARVPRGRIPTVCEIDLLPGEGALLAPRWIPWAERVTPEELEHNMEEGLLAQKLYAKEKAQRLKQPTKNGQEPEYTNIETTLALASSAHLLALR